MPRPPAPAPHPALLPVGTMVGPWRVVAWAGQGVHGAVYRAVRAGQENAGPVALKVALLPRDPRSSREATLLARVDHPSIPGLIDAGEWQHPGGTCHPYIAMELIDGVPLYDWARQHHPTSQQVLRLLAQLASALQALHAQGILHRDLKGDNVLVRRTDGRAVLTDFGSGIYAGAPTLTPQQLPPGTPAYRAPEAWLFELRFSREPTARYRAQPADDLFALGVTACRLVTGEYPELGAPFQDETGTWQLESVVPPAALLHDARVDPRLRALILRMLSVRPEQRGTAAELAEALEQAADHRPETPAAKGFATPPSPQGQARSGWSWLAMAASLALAMGVCWSAPDPTVEEPASARTEAVEPGQADAGPVGLGETAASASTVDAPEPAPSEVLAEDSLPEPQPGQARPDAKGRCPRKRQVALNGACWAPLKVGRDECETAGGQVLKERCYVPVLPPGRQPTSKPADQR